MAIDLDVAIVTLSDLAEVIRQETVILVVYLSPEYIRFVIPGAYGDSRGLRILVKPAM